MKPKQINITSLCLCYHVRISSVIVLTTSTVLSSFVSLLAVIFSLRVECSPMAWQTGAQSQVESYQRLQKWYSMPPCLTFSIIRYGSRVKLINPEKGLAPFPTPRCSSYWKGSLWVALNYDRSFAVASFLCLFCNAMKNNSDTFLCAHITLLIRSNFNLTVFLIADRESVIKVWLEINLLSHWQFPTAWIYLIFKLLVILSHDFLVNWKPDSK